MKKIIFALLFFLPLFLISCDDEETTPTVTTVLGDWELTEVYIDPGDGSGGLEPVSSNRVLTFNDDGTWTCNEDICFMNDPFPASSGSYSEADGTITADGCFTINYELINGELFLYYQCIEACTAKYEKP